jgi:hypothetical protein
MNRNERAKVNAALDARIAALREQVAAMKSGPLKTEIEWLIGTFQSQRQGRRWSDEQRAAHSEKMRDAAHQWTEEERAKLSATMKERSHKWSPEEKQAMSDRMTASWDIIKKIRSGEIEI